MWLSKPVLSIGQNLEFIMLKSSFDRLLSLNPIDKNAAEALRPGEHFSSIRRLEQVHLLNPVQCLPLPRDVQFVDRTGQKKGRMTAIGYLGSGLWLVRCVCGRYESRRNRAFRSDKNINDKCEECDVTEYLREGKSING